MKNYLILTLIILISISCYSQKKFHFAQCIFELDTTQIMRLSDSLNLSLVSTNIFKSKFPDLLNRTFDKTLISNSDCTFFYDFKRNNLSYSISIFKINSKKRLSKLNRLNLNDKRLVSPSVLKFEYKIINNYMYVVYTAVRNENLFLKEYIDCISKRLTD